MYDYDLIIMGGGYAGITALQQTSNLKKNVALVTEQLDENIFTPASFVRSTLFSSARILHFEDVSPQERFVQLKQILLQINEIRKDERNITNIVSSQGARLIFARAKFVDPHHILLSNGIVLSAEKFLICTGALPKELPRSFDATLYFVDNRIFSLPFLPSSIAIIGGGPRGCAYAQLFRSLGCTVTLIDRNKTILHHEDSTMSKVLTEKMINEGIRILPSTQLLRLAKVGEKKVLTYEYELKRYTESYDEVFVSVGKKPNVVDLGVYEGGMKVEDDYLLHNILLQTTQRHIYLAGDVSGESFTSQNAMYQAIKAVQTMFIKKNEIGNQVNGWVIDTDPMIAHCGKTEIDLKNEKKGYRTIQYPPTLQGFESDSNRLVKLFVDSRGFFLGAHIVGKQANDIIQFVIYAMQLKLPIQQFLSVIPFYPTLAFELYHALLYDLSNQ